MEDTIKFINERTENFKTAGWDYTWVPVLENLLMNTAKFAIPYSEIPNFIKSTVQWDIKADLFLRKLQEKML